MHGNDVLPVLAPGHFATHSDDRVPLQALYRDTQGVGLADDTPLGQFERPRIPHNRGISERPIAGGGEDLFPVLSVVSDGGQGGMMPRTGLQESGYRRRRVKRPLL